MFMIPVTPVVIPEPFAENGAKNTIPDQSPGGTEPNASWNTGFPPITMINRQAGGKPPLGADFNGILNALSQHAFFTQSGCIFPWRGSEDDFPGLNYLVGAHVLGADMKEYIAVQPSGPDIPASGGGYVGPRDPTTDSDRTWWRPAVTGGDLPEFDGTTIKLINGKYGVPEFTAPTASAPGTAGLVPGPEATPLQVQPLRVMGPNAEWNVLRQGSFDVSWDEANSKKIVLGAKYVQAGTSVDAIPYPGDFYCDAWNVPGISEALTGVLIRRDPGTYGMEEESVRSSFEILYDLSFDAIRFRKTTGGFAAGGAYTWSDWDTLLEKSSAAPVPTASDGVGQWIALQATSSGFAALPQGGTWACYFSGNGPLTNAAKAGGVVILPGGSTPSFGTYQWGSYNNVAPEAVLAWRIA
jgi:hypothetical protein